MSSRRVVISSITGKPIPWDDGTPAAGADDGAERSGRRAGAAGPPVIPNKAGEDAPEAGETGSREAQILRDVPPHWGTGG
ncbi:hypothetical protein DEO23_03730 [Brachybacterium endophyticum]|uniref:Uncharacterized protein n=1 Tax=Brachybacterium endophyticum TaxID=2182385 RepID=A0A2U2RPP0_9MICO|nr:hypothetical protein [Brachybacterium endophyticum]PWH07734.1 hypothetical protein DEO23_03730 [Brachybacterium endophyticum]